MSLLAAVLILSTATPASNVNADHSAPRPPPVESIAQWHPPRAPALLIPTPLGVERVGQLRKRQEAARKGARRKRRAWQVAVARMTTPRR